MELGSCIEGAEKKLLLKLEWGDYLPKSHQRIVSLYAKGIENPICVINPEDNKIYSDLRKQGLSEIESCVVEAVYRGIFECEITPEQNIILGTWAIETMKGMFSEEKKYLLKHNRDPKTQDYTHVVVKRTE